MKKFILISIGVLGLTGAVLAYLSLDLVARKGGVLELYPEITNIEELAIQLEEQGFVRRAKTIDFLAWVKSMERARPGRYEFEKGEDWPEILNRFRIGDQQPVNVVIPASSDLRQLSKRLGQQLMHDSARFYNYFLSDSALNQSKLTRDIFTTVFMPNTYELYWNISPHGLLERMQREQKVFWHKNQEKLTSIRLSQSEVVTLASIVEKETNKVDEMPRVAGLYLNRLRKGWKLQSDPTALFGIRQEHPDSVVRRVLYDHIRYDSPWNTYLYGGLPPGPISIPSSQAVNAVINAEENRYFYMVASVDRIGYHEFSKENEFGRHKSLARKYQRYLDEQGR